MVRSAEPVSGGPGDDGPVIGRRVAVTGMLSCAMALAFAPGSLGAGTPAGGGPAVTLVPEDGPFAWDLGERLQAGPTGAPGTPVAQVIPRKDRGGYFAKIVQRTGVYSAPGSSRRIWTAAPTTPHTGNATRLSVRRARFDDQGRPWLGIELPTRPNQTVGWVPYDRVGLDHTTYFVAVRLKSRTIEVWRDGRLVRSSKVVIGAAATPTPVGEYAVYEIAKQPSANDFLGPWALHLTAFSDVLDNYGGGPGRVAIHGRGPDSIRDAPLGAAGSHGCVRIPNDVVTWMHSRVHPGTPVRISDD